ncbi:MAG TPA: VanW family protein [Thermomicrobiales bacterium]|nr:VanW family protein [Thermomicrobiales bacterium]
MVQPTTTHESGGVSGRFSGAMRFLQGEGMTAPDWSRTARRIGPRLVAGAATLLLILAIGLLVFRVMFDDKIYPAVVVGDVEVGGLTMDQAQERLSDRARDLNLNSITFSYGEKAWTPTLTELGATIRTDAALEQAHSLGREDNAVSRLAFTGNILQDDQTVPLETSLDPTRLDAWFDTVDADIGNPAINAGIVVDGANVSFTPDSTGIVVNREAAKAQILTVLQTLQPVDAELPTVVDEPELRVADLEAGKAQVENVLSQPVQIRFEDQTWQVQGTEISQFLRVTSQMSDGKPRTVIDFDRDGLSSYLRETYAGQINRTPVDATVAFSDGLYATSPSVDGAAVMTNEFADVVAGSFLNGHEPVDVPVHVTKPKVDSNNLAALKIETLIGRGDSNFSGGSEERDHNIYTGIKGVDGTLVAPGEDFSFNGAVGAITPEAGYVESSVIVGEAIGRDVGGGICQVSTTVFRAALMAGFPMPEWYPHTYRLGGYERDGWGPGFDASILQLGDNPANWADYKFTNTTDGWILVQAWTSYPYAVVEIFGHDMGWNVELSEVTQSGPIKGEDMEVVDGTLPPGSIVEYAAPLDGLSVGFQRIVTDANGEVISDRWFQTDFAGRGIQYNVSPDMAGKSPGAEG